MGYCPHCGAELAESTEDVQPEGGVLVCTGCNMAVDPEDALAEQGTAEAPPPEHSPRGTDDNVLDTDLRPEDEPPVEPEPESGPEDEAPEFPGDDDPEQ